MAERGFKKSHTPWNKGVSHSEETKKKQSVSMKEHYKNHNSPMKGKKHSESSKEKNRQAHLKMIERNKERSFESIDSDWAKLMGYLLSDGYWEKNQTLKFVNNNLSFVGEVRNLAQRKGFSTVERPKRNGVEIHLKAFQNKGDNLISNRISEAPWRERFRRWGLYSRDSLGTFLNSPKELQISFLHGYFNGDGYLWVGKDRSHENRITRIEIGFCIGIHKKLAEDMQKMLLGWGIKSIIKSEWMKRSTRPFYRVLVAQRESAKKLIPLLDDSKYPEKFSIAKKLMKNENAKRPRGKPINYVSTSKNTTLNLFMNK